MARSKGETNPYPANCGEIATPQTDSLVKGLKEANSPTKVNHNVHHESFSRKGGAIETPATDAITKRK